MGNKIGITDEEILRNIEYKLTNFKHKLIDETYLFNEETIFSLEYLEKLHIFLFCDIYEEDDCKIRNSISELTRKKLQMLLDKIKTLTYDMNKEELANCIYDIWKEQIFLDGNTRTLRAFLKVYCYGYNIHIDHNFDEDILDDYFIPRLMEEIVGKKDNIVVK